MCNEEKKNIYIYNIVLLYVKWIKYIQRCVAVLWAMKKVYIYIYNIVLLYVQWTKKYYAIVKH